MPWSSGLDFGVNDYLDLARSPKIIEAMSEAAHRYGAGGRASRLLRGGCPLHTTCEHSIAAWLGAEAGLLFPSGYQANIGLVTASVGRGDAVLSDRDNHASLIDGARLSGARILIYEHLDLDDLERQLCRASSARRRLVVTESVFSMRGDLAPLEAIAELCIRHDAWLVVDEAHAIGVLGPEGAGAWADTSISTSWPVFARVVTGGKALGVGGAAVVGSHELRSHLVNFARSFMFTTAPPPALVAGLETAVGVCRAANAERERVRADAGSLAAELGLPQPAAAIVPIPVGDADQATSLSRKLFDEGLSLPAVRPPTVAPGESLLRAVCRAGHCAEDRDTLIEALRAHWPPPTRGVSVESRRTRRPVVVVGTDTGIGKTVVSAILVRSLHATGQDFAYWKPVQTGSDDDTRAVRELAAVGDERCLPVFASYPLPASPHEAAADVGDQILVGQLDEAYVNHCHTVPTRQLVVELAGGLFVPYTLDPRPVTQADWLSAAKADVVLVARSGLGTLNHTLLTLEALRSRRIQVRALFLVGDAHESNHRTLQEIAGVPHVVALPILSPLGTPQLDRWIAGHTQAIEEIFE